MSAFPQASSPRPQASCAPDPWIPLATAALKLGLNAKHLTRRCRTWEGQSLARKQGGLWFVHINTDPRLRGETDLFLRDAAQLTDLRQKGTRPKYIERGEARRDIVQAFAAFWMARRNQRMTDVVSLYVGELYANGKVGPKCTIKKVSHTQFFAWKAAYENSGIAGLVDQYGDRSRPAAIGAEAWVEFLGFKHGPGNPSLNESWKLVAALARAKHRGDPKWAWPACRTVRRHYDETVHPAAAAITTLGPFTTEGKFLPKIARTLEDIPAGAHFVGDQRTMDFFVRVPDGSGGWRKVRPKLTAVMDVRSRAIVGWYLGESANSDTILSTYRMAADAIGSISNEFTVDNGRDYRSIAGKSRRGPRKWDEFDSKRIFSAFERMQVIVHYAIARHPWSKGWIESRFNTIKDRFDRHMVSFCGGDHDERPWDLERWTKLHIGELHTMEEAIDQFQDFLNAFHEEIVTGDGSFGLCPRQLLRQYFMANPRPVADELLQLYCTRMEGPVKVGRDGVRYRNVRYGKLDEEVWRLMGKQVYLLADPVEAHVITLCNEKGEPICKAYADRNYGQTNSELRAAEGMRKRAKRMLKEFVRTRDDAIATDHQLVAKLRHQAALAAQIPDTDLPAVARPETLRLAGENIVGGAERLKRAAGGEAIKRLNEMNAGAQAVNARHRAATLEDLPVDVESAERPRRADFDRLLSKRENNDAPW